MQRKLVVVQKQIRISVSVVFKLINVRLTQKYNESFKMTRFTCLVRGCGVWHIVALVQMQAGEASVDG